ncbi:unnamed protein product [Clavelina lepadiformis]|uniref:Uncharacterized protein n=1 Tax=Clavelina lepadiformis TaxID=159417 RepID=A0ABP0G6C6_CLALP
MRSSMIPESSSARSVNRMERSVAIKRRRSSEYSDFPLAVQFIKEYFANMFKDSQHPHDSAWNQGPFERSVAIKRRRSSEYLEFSHAGQFIKEYFVKKSNDSQHPHDSAWNQGPLNASTISNVSSRNSKIPAKEC